MASSSMARVFILCMTVVAIAIIAGDLVEAVKKRQLVNPKTRTPIHQTSIQVAVDGSNFIATIDDEFVCATLDWWPVTKCNYGSCPWYSASILNLDLKNPILEEAAKALAPLKVRLGGTLEDIIVYDIDSAIEPCLPILVNSSAPFGFSGGCLPMQRWDALNQFFKKTGVSVAFGLNALYGRTPERSWNPSNAADFIRYSHDQGYPITAWELGNELLGASTVGMGISPRLYAEDIKILRTIINNVYQNDTTKPLVVAPDAFYQFGDIEYQEFLAESGPNVVDVVTRHFYNLGPGVTRTEALVDRILDPDSSNGEASNYAGLQTILRDYPWITAWIGESGGAYNSGHANVTDAFIMAFWYLNQLGLASKHNNKAFCRQTLIGGHYGLLDAISYAPNPDFYGVLLWQKLMGKGVLYVDASITDIRAYAHCQKNSTKGGVTVLLLNYSKVTSYSVDVSLGHSNLSKISHAKQQQLAQGSVNLQGRRKFHTTMTRLEYLMSPAGGDILGHVVSLNGKPLRLTSSWRLPELEARVVDNSTPVSLDPLTYAFVVLNDALADACISG